MFKPKQSSGSSLVGERRLSAPDPAIESGAHPPAEAKAKSQLNAQLEAQAEPQLKPKARPQRKPQARPQHNAQVSSHLSSQAKPQRQALAKSAAESPNNARKAAIQAGQTPPKPDLDDLVTAACNGNRDAFALLYGRYRGAVHAVVLARVPMCDVSDLVQDVFLVALRRLSRLRNAQAFGSWLLTIARNRIADYHRQTRPKSELSTNLATNLAADLGADSPVRAQAAQALNAIRSLPEAYRETLIMRLVEGMTGPEIAERTGLQPDSVRVNLHRGMKLLRQALEARK